MTDSMAEVHMDYSAFLNNEELFYALFILYTGCPKTNVTHEDACNFLNFNAILFIFQIFTAERLRKLKPQTTCF